jgi:hypothetical protein
MAWPEETPRGPLTDRRRGSCVEVLPTLCRPYEAQVVARRYGPLLTPLLRPGIPTAKRIFSRASQSQDAELTDLHARSAFVVTARHNTPTVGNVPDVERPDANITWIWGPSRDAVIVSVFATADTVSEIVVRRSTNADLYC